MADVTLEALEKVTRKRAGVPSSALYTQEEVYNQIDFAYRYDLPANLKLTSLRRTFTFYTDSNVDHYKTNTTDENNPLYNFKNIILQTSDPIYVGGYPVYFSQSRAEFYARWPLTQLEQTIATGDGVTTQFSGTLTQVPLLPGNTNFVSKNSDGNSIGLQDVQLKDITYGTPDIEGNFYSTLGPIPTTNPTTTIVTNTIHYNTGVYTVTFDEAPASGEPIYAMWTPERLGRPTSILFFNNQFIVRPIPDKQYPVTIECQVRPTELINSGDVPELEDMFDYISFLAAKRICEDRNDYQRIQVLMPSLKEYEAQVLKRRLRQDTDKRSATIYNTNVPSGNLNGNWWRGFN